jgi:endonuclease-8
MPEGPSIVLLCEEVEQFSGRKVLSVSGNSKIDQNCLTGKKVLAFKSWGKHFLICFKGFTVRVHFLLFGSYRINEKRVYPPRLSLTFNNGEINLYACAVKILEGDPDTHYDWSADVMQDAWDSRNALKKLKAIPEQKICDTLLEQEIFAGVGNIIKNEVLYRKRIHPESKVGSIPPAKLKAIIKDARVYSFLFLNWKRNYVLKKNYQVHTRKICPNCGGSLTKKITGVKKRRSFFCRKCQLLLK